MKIHNSDDDNYAWLSSSSAMMWTSDDKVLISWWLSLASGQKGYKLENGSGDSDHYDGHLRLAQFG